MKTLFKFFTVIFLLNYVQVQAQVSVSIYYHDNREIETNLYGFHMSNFFEQCICYDPDSSGLSDPDIDQCMDFAAALKPKVVRFPAGGDHKFMHLLDDDGYGRRYADIDEFEDKGWITSTTATAEYGIINQQNSDYDDIRFLNRFIDFLEFCEEENGFKPDVIFVANIILGKTTLYTNGEIAHENLEAMKYLMANGVKITGIELGNEHYDDKKEVNSKAIFNDGASPPKLSFDDYFQT
ncbi:MAG TPA: hypothetical protein VFM99_05755 [Chitinophagales bacterium]|nr:hypothetical protein [Chitinophagales bacterium]